MRGNQRIRRETILLERRRSKRQADGVEEPAAANEVCVGGWRGGAVRGLFTACSTAAQEFRLDKSNPGICKTSHCFGARTLACADRPRRTAGAPARTAEREAARADCIVEGRARRRSGARVECEQHSVGALSHFRSEDLRSARIRWGIGWESPHRIRADTNFDTTVDD